MNKKEAEELVDELLQAAYEYETFNRKSYQKYYFEMKRRVIEALTATK